MTVLLFNIVTAKFQFEIEGRTFTAGGDKIALIDCRKPHDYRSTRSSEFLWIHLDGANARKFFEEIVASKRNRQAFSVPNVSEWPLCELAGLVAMSTSHFCRYFKERTGTSPHQFVLLKRVDRAKHLLNSTRLSVKEIAFQVGFHGESRFATAFRARSGRRPKTTGNTLADWASRQQKPRRTP